MKKVLFLMFLLFLCLGTVNVNAQVRIGGNTAPNSAAVLDLNATDATTGTKGLALPRVSLASNTAQITTGVANLTGMLVYNTNTTLGVGIYFWNGSNWIIISGDGIVGNELTDTIAGGGLNKTGTGTAASPYKVGIAPYGVDTSMLKPPTSAGISFFATSNGIWKQLKWEYAHGFSHMSIVPDSVFRDTLGLHGCVTKPQVFITSDPGPVAWSYFPQDTIIWVKNITKTTMHISVYTWCWR